MTIFGLEIRRKRVEPIAKQAGTLSSVESRGGWFRVLESFPGAWQRNVEVSRDSVLTHNTVFACITLIAQDIAKLWVDLVQIDDDGISTPTTSPAFSSILETPNHYQNRLQFLHSWVLAKLIHGNAYILKGRDGRNVVNELHVLDSQRVKPLVARTGDVYYELKTDQLAGLETEQVLVPASEIIHDRMYTLFHPLVGLSPITACGLAATQALNIQNHSTSFFANRAMLGGVILVPGQISDENVTRLRKNFEDNYLGAANAGRFMLLSDGMTFQQLPVMNAVDAQLIESLKLSAESIPPVFHVPLFKVGLGPMPSYNNIQAVNLQYLSDCLQFHIESIETCLTAGIELPDPYAVEFDEDALLRMDTLTSVEASTKGIVGGLFKINEGRARMNLPPVDGGDTVYLQQQEWSLQALNRRDQQQPAPPSNPAQLPPANDAEVRNVERDLEWLLRKDWQQAA
jgi:HK97 family phage portal protein